MDMLLTAMGGSGNLITGIRKPLSLECLVLGLAAAQTLRGRERAVHCPVKEGERMSSGKAKSHAAPRCSHF